MQKGEKMKKTIQLLTACCLALFMLISVSDGVSAATASSVWVRGIELTDGDYLVGNDDTTATSGALTQPTMYVAWYHDGILVLHGVHTPVGKNFPIQGKNVECGICADGDLTIDVNLPSTITGGDRTLFAGIAANGDITVSSERDYDMLYTSGGSMGIYSNGGDITFRGYSRVFATGYGYDDQYNGGIFADGGDIYILDGATVNASAGLQNQQSFAAGICAYNGNVMIGNYAEVYAGCGTNSTQSAGIYAGPAASDSSGNITCMGHVKVTACGGASGMYATRNIHCGNSATAAAQGNQYGVAGAKNLTIDQAWLRLYSLNHGVIKGNPDIILNNASLSAATYGRINGNLGISVDDLSKIGYNDSAETYVYNGEVNKPIQTLDIVPNHLCTLYSDHTNWAWATPYNCFVIENGIMGSVNAGSKYFDTNGTVTRGMVVTVLYRLAGSPALSDADYAKYNEKFSDVKKDDWYYNAVVWAFSKGVTAGISDTSFAPQQKTSREQIVTFFWRFSDFLGYDNSGEDILDYYDDSSEVSSYAIPAFQWSVTYGIVNGTSDTTLSPKDSCTRGQMAKIIAYFTLIFMYDENWIDIMGL